MKIKIKISHQKIKTLIFSGVFILIISSLLYVSSFLYENFYKTITQSEEIKILQKKVAIDTVDIDKFNEIIKKIEEKTNISNNIKINNPFK